MTDRNLATFYLEDELFGVDILQIKEVIQDVRPYSVPLAFPFVRGLINLRGQIVTVIDPGWRLLDSRRIYESGTCIVLKTHTELESLLYSQQWLESVGSDPIGLLVDRMGDVVEVDESDIHPPPGNLNEKIAPMISGIVKVDDRLVSILSLEVLTSL